MMSIAVKPKKRGRPATGKDPLIGVRFPPALTKAIDAFAAAQVPQLSRSEAVRLLAIEGLMREKLLPSIAEQIQELYDSYKQRQGLLPHREDPEGAN